MAGTFALNDEMLVQLQDLTGSFALLRTTDGCCSERRTAVAQDDETRSVQDDEMEMPDCHPGLVPGRA